VRYYRVAANTPFNNSLLTYKSQEIFNLGDIVQVTVGKRSIKACILNEVKSDELESDSGFEIKEVEKIDDDLFSFSKDHLDFLTWAAKYYHYPLGQHLFDILPKAMKRAPKIKSELGKNKDLSYDLTDEQKEALCKIRPSINKFDKFLLHGVTGSGKTSVYIELLKDSFENKKNALLLIPEINLTPGLINTLREYLPYQIHSYHSAVTNSQRDALWRCLNKEDTPYLIVGVRSSLFLPMENLGMIIVDEEHDGSYKQSDRMCYNARDLAIKKAHMSGCPVVLASATPSLETFFPCHEKDRQYASMKKRPSTFNLPEIILRDKRVEQVGFDDLAWPFLKESLDEIQEVINKGEQAVIFVNRLGFANYIQCHGCGHCFECKNCSLSLKYYKSKNRLGCQTCDYSTPLPPSCPQCGNLKLLQKGYGTEKLEEVITSVIKGARVARFDRDHIKTFNKLTSILDDFNKGESNILIGTQMLSKGHNFKNVNYVLVMGIDSQLNFPDFRSSENTYQLLTQISGRSGRFSNYGKVVVETFDPENKIFNLIKENNFSDFYKNEILVRKTLNLPPFSKMCTLYITGKNQNKVSSYSIEIEKLAKNLSAQHFKRIDVLGARPTFVEKRANKFTWLILIRSADVASLHNFINTLENNRKKEYSLGFKVDIDPQVIL